VLINVYFYSKIQQLLSSKQTKTITIHSHIKTLNQVYHLGLLEEMS